MDATFFIILIGIAVSVIAATGDHEEKCMHEDLSEVCSFLFSAQMSEKAFGYEGDRVMNVTDLAALSILKGDGLLEKYLKSYFDWLYPWENAYSVRVSYSSSMVQIGNASPESEHSLEQSYAVEYGGHLTVEMHLSA